ncbi:hypothetical protein CLV62_104116 [Dysgonomonas alginatilytica]|uniref:Uncharacterized protein n=1 Tax=Dysgonomonas alginatilytica TaxID=1605892 RepID=A0A2V3PU64_9BACT|nr:hypothetical protein [Dysgonomonas alginatilytica]PXV66855.1 hypothetical protein CLV62_104116 [Dysgonomonas alginatilytica]
METDCNYNSFTDTNAELYINVVECLRKLIRERGVKSEFCDENCLKIKNIYPKFDEIVLVKKNDNLILVNQDAQCSLSFIEFEDLCRISDDLSKL